MLFGAGSSRSCQAFTWANRALSGHVGCSARWRRSPRRTSSSTALSLSTSRMRCRIRRRIIPPLDVRLPAFGLPAVPETTVRSVCLRARRGCHRIILSGVVAVRSAFSAGVVADVQVQYCSTRHNVYYRPTEIGWGRGPRGAARDIKPRPFLSPEAPNCSASALFTAGMGCAVVEKSGCAGNWSMSLSLIRGARPGHWSDVPRF